ncbi:hypothetical protein SeLEV6574_g00668 [Synchytrium endobioticum]|uniref:Transmembrane protein 14C n=1 Tax=Synchytrium endobioticum TaxID=286115 RepID=A0A507DGU3_9FUNG|nr:hypothetical protein SeLEV6574_g00668 [Synchytrium endobioticum]
MSLSKSSGSSDTHGSAVINPNPTNTETAAAALTTTASHLDPYPHYVVGALSAAGAGYAYSALQDRRLAAIAGGIAVAFFYGGYQLQRGYVTLGYDVGTLASTGLLAVAFPRMMKHRETYSTVMATLGGVSLLGNATKSYQVRKHLAMFERPQSLFTPFDTLQEPGAHVI